MKTKKIIPVENLKNDIAKQPNEFTNAIFKGTALAYKLILFALYRTVKEQNPITPNKKNIYCAFTKNEFCERLGIPIGSKTMDLIKNATDELSESFLTLENSNGVNDHDVWLRKMPWFQKVEVMLNGSVCLKFNQEIADFFDFKIGYTALELLEIGNLRSFYAIRYYGFAKSKSGFCGENGNQKNEWWFELTEDEIRKFFELGKNDYPRRNTFVEKVIKNPCEEINEKTNIKIELEYEKLEVGKYKWRFVCSNKVEEAKKIKKTDRQKEIEIKRQINREADEVDFYKTKYPEKFAEYLKIAESQQTLPFGIPIFLDAQAVQMLKKELGEIE